MNLFAAFRKKDYKVFAVPVFFLAVLFGILTEHLLYGISSEKIGAELSDFALSFMGCKWDNGELLQYVLKTELKKYLVMVLISFSVIGIVVNQAMFFATVFRYIFLLTAVYRSGIGSGYILCIGAVLLCLFFSVPAFLYCIRLSYHSYLCCKSNKTKLWHCTKYQLQTELKMGIIMLVYITFGAVVQSLLCTGLFERMFQ